MLNNLKWFFYLKHMILMSTGNKVRMILTSIGIFVAVFLFSAGLIITNSYYNGQLKIIDEMTDNTVMITSSKLSKDVKTDISAISNIKPTDVALLYEQKTIMSTSIANNQYLTVTASIHGISTIDSFVPVVTDDGLLLPVQLELVKGRLISQADIQTNAKVVVIDELTASLLFPNQECLGKQLELDAGTNGTTTASDKKTDNIKLEVVGVVSNSYLAETRKLNLKKELEKSSDNIFVKTSIYCPLSMLSQIYTENDTTRYYIYQPQNENEYDAFVDAMISLSEVSSRRNETYTVSTKEILHNKVQHELSYTKSLLNVIILILCIISGISIMSITFFSVKERVPEIGIRKAFGASKLDIAFQFVFEMVMIALVVSIFAVCTSYYACKFAEDYFAAKFYISFVVSVTNGQLAIPVFVGLIEAVVCSIIPSLYAAKIKVTDSLRFE